MTELVTTGTWVVATGSETAFVKAWAGFAAWASDMPGAGTLRLGRDTDDPQRFLSFAAWDDSEAVRHWKGSPDFREHLAQVLQYADGFHPLELDIVVTAAGGASAIAYEDGVK